VQRREYARYKPKKLVHMTTVSSVLSLLTSGNTYALAMRFGGTTSEVQAGIATSANAIVVGAAKRSGDTTFMTRLFDLARKSDIGNISGVLRDVIRGIGTSPILDQGEQLAAMVFRKDRTAIEHTVGQFSGLGSHAGNELMTIAAPLILAVLRQRIHDQGLTVSSFTTFLAAEAAKVEELPASLSKLLIGGFIPATESIYPKKPKLTRAPRGWILPVSMVALALVARSLSGGANRGLTPNLPSNAKHALVSGTLNGFFVRKLPDGAQLNIPEQGIEGELIRPTFSLPQTSCCRTWQRF